MNLIFIFCALICCLLAFFVDGLYIRGKRIVGIDTYNAKRLFLNMMFLSIMSLCIGVILTIIEN